MSRIGHKINMLAKQQQIGPNRLRALFALERIVARLENNPKLSKSLVYKGGFVLVKTIDTDRFTRDLDALAFGISQDLASKLIVEAVQTDLKDRIIFGDPHVREIDTTGNYSGIRVDLCFQLDVGSLDTEKISKLPRVHVDIGFGKALPVKNAKITMPSIVSSDDVKVSWSVYPLEFISKLYQKNFGREPLQSEIIFSLTNLESMSLTDFEDRMQEKWVCGESCELLATKSDE